MNNILERLWKDAVWPSLRYRLIICLAGLKKPTEDVSENIWFLGRDLNVGPLETILLTGCNIYPENVSRLQLVAVVIQLDQRNAMSYTQVT